MLNQSDFDTRQKIGSATSNLPEAPAICPAPGSCVGQPHMTVTAARNYLKSRRKREAMLAGLFSDPAWDILIDLYVASMEGRKTSVSNACIASAVPSTTALRYIARMNQMGLLDRFADNRDRRLVLLSITERGETIVRDFLFELIKSTHSLGSFACASFE